MLIRLVYSWWFFTFVITVIVEKYVFSLTFLFFSCCFLNWNYVDILIINSSAIQWKRLQNFVVTVFTVRSVVDRVHSTSIPSSSSGPSAPLQGRSRVKTRGHHQRNQSYQRKSTFRFRWTLAHPNWCSVNRPQRGFPETTSLLQDIHAFFCRKSTAWLTECTAVFTYKCTHICRNKFAVLKR